MEHSNDQKDDLPRVLGPKQMVPFVVNVGFDEFVAGKTVAFPFDIRCASTTHVGTWMLQRRFADFARLDVAVRRAGLTPAALPPSPSEATRAAVSGCALLLTRYSNQLLQQEGALRLAEVHSFFEVDRHIWSAACALMSQVHAVRTMQRWVRAFARRRLESRASTRLQAAARGRLARTPLTQQARALHVLRRHLRFWIKMRRYNRAVAVTTRNSHFVSASGGRRSLQPSKVRFDVEVALFYRRVLGAISCAACGY